MTDETRATDGPGDDEPSSVPASASGGRPPATAQPRLLVDVVHDPRVCLALQQNAVPFVRQIRIANTGDIATGPVRVTIATEPEICGTLELDLAGLDPGAVVTLPRPDVPLRSGRLGSQTEREAGDVVVSVSRPDGELLAERRSPVEILAYDEWPGTRSLPEILAAFVLPNHPEIEDVLARAAVIVGGRTGRSGLDGYQSRDPQRALAQVAAIYDAIGELGLAYVAPPASYEENGQKIRTPERVRAGGVATCLDLACFAAACLEQAGLHGLLVVVEGHAFSGAWLSEESFGEPTVAEPSALSKRFELERLVLFETTGVTQSPALPFGSAIQEAAARLANPDAFRFAIDVRAARRARIRPLPIRVASSAREVPDEAPVPRDVALPAPFGDAAASGASVDTPLDTPSDAEALTASTETPATRTDRWKRRLLDLTLRNRLIAHRDTKKTVPLLCPDVAQLEDALADGRTFRVLAAPTAFGSDDPRDGDLAAEQQGVDPRDAFLREEMDARRLHAGLAQDELERRLLEIFRAARMGLEESGANTLFLALGFLEWFETPESPQPRLAPLLLLPLEMQRKTVRSGFRIRLLDDEPRVNVTLLRKLEAEFGITIDGVDPPPEDESGLDVPALLRRVREAVLDVPRWRVVEDAAIGLFSFTKFLMWRDLEAHADMLTGNAVVRHLVETPGQPFDDGIPLPAEDAADLRAPSSVLCPMDADASQMRAILAAEAGKSFVLQGPPGTGKSQTITNLIAHCLASGLRVLFVAEKRAALDVVHGRLERVGLGPFSLAVHSNRASKREVLESLGEALRHAQLTEPASWTDAGERLAALRDELNRFAAALHLRRSAGLTAFEVLSGLVGLRNTTPLPLEIDDLAALGTGALAALRDAGDVLHAEAQALGGVAAHALLPVEIERWDPSLPERVHGAARRLVSAVETLEVAAGRVAERAGVPGVATSTTFVADLLAWGALLQAAVALAAAPEEALVSSGNFARDAAGIAALVVRGRARDTERTRLLVTYTPAVLDVPHARLAAELRSAAATFWPLSWWRGRRARAAVRAFALGSALPSDAALADDLDAAAFVRAETEDLAAPGCDGARLLGPAWRGGDADWDAVLATVAWAERCRASASRFAGDDLDARAALRARWLDLVREGRDLFAPGGPVPREVAALDAALAAFASARVAFVDLLALDVPRAFGADGAPGDVAVTGGAARDIDAARDDLRGWAAYHRARRTLRAHGAGPVVRSLESDEIDACELGDVLSRSFLEVWARTELSADPVLAEFSGTGHALAIERFRALDHEVLRTAAEVVRGRLAARLPRDGGAAATGSASEMGILQRELGKRARHKPIRRLFAEIPNVLARLKPCLLMSPLSVAQYLGPDMPRHDLVVFDEASQIPVWDAVGAIARGDRLVVVGDSRQLPPTSFFDQAGSEDDLGEEEVEDLESILDECVAGGLPELRLRWHYRSRHESLITFSNRHYYGGRLVTFPNAAGASPRLGVSLHPVPDGVYDRAKTRTNRGEAEALVADVLRRLRDPDECARSIGVVTFSMAQQTLVEDLLDDARRRDPDLEEFFSDSVAEPLFVKNLESVQGDERDVILFSVGYGPDAKGNVSMNFGPLNRDGGERRLNVAVTRAREQVVVFSTLRAEQIDLVRTRATGVAHLRAFLEYAQRGASTLPPARASATSGGASAAATPLADDVAALLADLGHDVDRRVGCSEFRVDLAIRDPRAPDRHALGVVLDGANYAGASTARDRDRLREEVLSRLGWRLHHVWSLDWWYDRERETARLVAAIDSALAGDAEPARTPAPERPRFAAAPPPPASTPPAPVYRALDVAHLRGDASAFRSAASTSAVEDVIRDVAAAEAPLTTDLLVRRVAAHWGIGRIVRAVSDRVSQAAQGAGAGVEFLPEPGGGSVVWRTDQEPGAWSEFRAPEPGDPEPRSMDDIPLVEIAAAARHALAAHVAIARDDLAREAARLFGISRLGRRVRERARVAIDLLAERGEAVVDGETVRLPPTA